MYQLFRSLLQLIKIYVSLSYFGYHVPVPEWFRYGDNCKVVKKVCKQTFRRIYVIKGRK